MNRRLCHRYLASSPLLRLPAQRSSDIISTIYFYSSSIYSFSCSFASLRFSHSSSNNNNSHGGVTQPSKRKEFAALSPDPATLDLLDRLHLGYLPKRRNRVAVAKKFGNVSKSQPNYNNNDKARHSNNNNNNRSGRGQQDSPRLVPPFPFHRLGRPVLKVDHFDNLDHKLFLSLLPQPPRGVLHPSRSSHGISSLQPPVSTIPEVAIVGRSNVGKSSLLNALLRLDDSFVQKASVSPKPGETRSLQFFALGTQPERLLTWDSRDGYRQNSHNNNERRGGGTEEEEGSSRPAGDKTVQKVHLPALLLVDLPGYGFAFLNEETMLRCQDLCSRYLLDSHHHNNNSSSERQEQQGSHGELYSRNRALKRVLLLLDARHGFKLTDKTYFEGLLEHRQRLLEEEHGGKEAVRRNQVKISWKLQIVLTKCDLVDRLTLARRMKLVRDQVNDFLPGLGSNLQVIPVSSKDNRGILELQQQLAALVPASVRPAPDSPHARPYFHPIRRHSLASTSTSSARKERKQLRAKREARAEKAGVGLYYADGSVGTARIKNRWVTGFGDKLCRAERRRLQFGNPDGSPVRVRAVVDDDGYEVSDNSETETRDHDSRRRRSGKNKEKRMPSNESFPSQGRHPSSESSDNSRDRKHAASRSRHRDEEVHSDRGDKKTSARSPRNSSHHQRSVTNPAIVDVDDALQDDIVAPWETAREPNTSPGGRRRPKKPTKK